MTAPGLRIPARPTHKSCTPAADDEEAIQAASLRDMGHVVQLEDEGEAFLGREWRCVICREDLSKPVVLTLIGGNG